MLSYKNDLSSAEQTKLDTLIDGVDMANKVALLVSEEFEIVDKTMFDKMNEQVFEFEEDAGEIVSEKADNGLLAGEIYGKKNKELSCFVTKFHYWNNKVSYFDSERKVPAYIEKAIKEFNA